MPEGQSARDRAGGQISVVARHFDGGIAVVPAGEVDIATAPVIEEEIHQAAIGHDLVALDLSQVTFMDSTGLQLMIAADRDLRERGGRLIVITGPPQVARLLALTRADEQLTVVEDLDAWLSDR